MNIKAVLFDMDGVLVHSEHLIKAAAKRALAQWGVTAQDEDFVPFVGAGEDKFVGGVAEKHGVPYDLAMKAKAYEIYLQLLEKEDIGHEGVKQTLLTLKEQGYKLAVCSSADEIKVSANLRAIDCAQGIFDYVVSGDKVPNKKPAPDLFLNAMQALGMNSTDCVVIEDALNGIQAARAAGMQVIGITTYFDEQTLRKEGPDAVCMDIRDIVAIIGK